MWIQESAFALRRRADAMVAQGRFNEAAELYRREAAIYRKNGDLNAAIVEESKADRYGSTLRLFIHLPGSLLLSRENLALHEPPYGCYLGAFLDRDERLGQGFMENSQIHRDPSRFAELTGKKLASVYCYLQYGRPFPSGWVERLKRQGVAPHIAFEPNNGLDSVQDDGYLREWAQAAGRAQCPIFLRFASEMNGDWTRYGGDPRLYKRKWGTVYSRMRQFAPNVAMVWCVNHIPETNIPEYYPGDNYVDWVGVNFYSVPFYDNNPDRPGLFDTPADRVRTVYRLYAAKKPIAICEFGASRLSTVDGRDRSDWAAAKIAELFTALPRLYPRVKLVDIFDNDNIQYAQPGRQKNNYSVTDSETVRAAYAAAVAPDYFLSDVGKVATPERILPLDSVIRTGRGILRVSAWARCYAKQPALIYKVNGSRVATITTPGPREAAIPFEKPGHHTLEAVLMDDRAKPAARKAIKVIVT
ncbi:MAG: hypothetical protein OHK0029_32370 [Armatimonadaceae bacterium]